jgi:hypothetical protein
VCSSNSDRLHCFDLHEEIVINHGAVTLLLAKSKEDIKVSVLRTVIWARSNLRFRALQSSHTACSPLDGAGTVLAEKFRPSPKNLPPLAVHGAARAGEESCRRSGLPGERKSQAVGAAAAGIWRQGSSAAASSRR